MRPVPPSIVITSPARSFVPRIVTVVTALSMWTSAEPTTAGMPHPRATTAAWLTMPPRVVRMPLRHLHAENVVRRRLGTHEDHRLVGLGGADRRIGGEHDASRRRAGGRGQPLPDRLDVVVGIERHMEELGEFTRCDRVQRVGHGRCGSCGQRCADRGRDPIL